MSDDFTPEELRSIREAEEDSVARLGRRLTVTEVEIARRFGKSAVGTEERWGYKDRSKYVYPADKQAQNEHFARMDAIKAADDEALFEKLAREHIEWLDSNLEAVRKLGDVRIPTFSQLAIRYERGGRLQEALEIAQKANRLGLRDNSGDHFENRIAKLEKRIAKGQAAR
jgi:hypothetical protein